MSASKYAFAKTLKEVRFLFCQTSEQSAPLRYGQTMSLPRTRRALRLGRHSVPSRKKKKRKKIVLIESCCICTGRFSRAHIPP